MPAPAGLLALVWLGCAPQPAQLLADGPESLRAWDAEPLALPALRVVDAHGAALLSEEPPRWEVEPPEVARLRDDGTHLLPQREGEASLVARLGALQVERSLSVVFPDAITLFGANANQRLPVGQRLLLVAVVSNLGESIEAAPVQWQSSDPRVIAVHGGMIEALTEGTATVTARSGLAEAVATLRVTPEPRRRALARHSDHPVAM
jgi:hypothetical protein